MQHYSFSTLLMAVIFSNVIIVITAICFCHKKTLVAIGYKMFTLLLGLTLFRILVPLQFPFVTNIVLCDSLSYVVANIRRPFYMVGSCNFSMWNIFEVVWVAGILVKLTLFVKKQLVFNHYVVWYSINRTDDERYSRLLDEICGDRPNPFCVFELQGIKVPVLYGMHNPRILIPAGLEMPEAELRCLLAHETAHHYHHDILIKLGLSLLTIVYWWNLACYPLKSQLDAILEMRIDNSVAGDTEDSKYRYLSCLVYVAEYCSNNGTKSLKIPENSIALFSSRSYNNLTNRFNIMDETPKPYARSIHAVAFTLTAAMFILSYAFIFEARYTAPEDDMVTIDLSGNDTYAVLNEDSTYNIYYGGFLMDTVDTLDNYHEGMTVYKSIDEVPAELRVIIE